MVEVIAVTMLIPVGPTSVGFVGLEFVDTVYVATLGTTVVTVVMVVLRPAGVI